MQIAGGLATDRQRDSLGAAPRIPRGALGFRDSGQLELTASAASWGLIPQLSLLGAAALLVAALANGVPPADAGVSQLLFWGSTCLWLLPLISRLAWPVVSRWERLGLLILAAMGLYVLKIIASPVGFGGFDEFLHWRTAEDILSHGRLFTPNPLLPISPLYPALEIVTTALASMTGLSIFVCAMILIGVARVLFICALFLFFERVMSSTRLSALACVVYMSNWNFVLFDAAFAYESLAIVFLVMALLAEASTEAGREGDRTYTWIIAAPFIIALATTHHLTAFFAILFMALLSGISRLGGGPLAHRMAGAILLVTAAVATWAWSHLMRIPLAGYYAPEMASALDDIYTTVTTFTLPRKPFTASDGFDAPLWLRITAFSAVAILCAGLATGFFRTLALAEARVSRGRYLVSLSWTNSRLVLLTILTLGYPVSMVLRLTGGGWELGNRLAPFIYLGIGPVVAVAVAGFCQRSAASRFQAFTVGAALTVVVMGGVLVGWDLRDIPQHYRVAADAASIEPMGISASEWTRNWLGEDNNFAADRTNQILLSTYGRQHLVTQEDTRLDIAGVLLLDHVGPEELNAIKIAGLDYLLIDLRMTQALPAFGNYVSNGEPWKIHEAPPDANALLKFNRLKDVGRSFDDGFIVIYDLRKLTKVLRDGRE